MRTLRYDKATKQAILNAVLDARKGGKAWAGAFEAALNAGYKGSVGGIVQMVRNAKKQPAKRRRRKASTGAPIAKVVTPAKPKPKANDIATLIENLVKTRMNSAIEEAVSVLRQMRK